MERSNYLMGAAGLMVAIVLILSGSPGAEWFVLGYIGGAIAGLVVNEHEKRHC